MEIREARDLPGVVQTDRDIGTDGLIYLLILIETCEGRIVGDMESSRDYLAW